jgi:hypothetical protein
VRQDATHTGDNPDADLKRSVVQGVKEAGPDADLEEAGRGRPDRTNRRRDAALSERGQPCGQTSPRAALEEVSRAEQVDDKEAHGKKRMARKKRMAESAWLEAHGWRRMARRHPRVCICILCKCGYTIKLNIQGYAMLNQ